MMTRSLKGMVLIAPLLIVIVGATLLIEAARDQAGSAARPGLREVGIKLGQLQPGPLNAITDVAGVAVGHATLIKGDDLRTGVTVIKPHEGNLFQEKVPAAIHVMNGFGKLIGVTQVNELGALETPIALTGTLSVWKVADALAEWMLELPGNERVRSINPVVGECNDGYLSDIRQRPVGRLLLRQALEATDGGSVAQGSIGAGAGTRCLGFKGGIGTSSRRLQDRLGGWTIGVLVQTNFGGTLRIAGVPVGQELGRAVLADPAEASKTGDASEARPQEGVEKGSCMIVLATDAPLDSRQLRRLAARTPMGLARTGAFASNGSGDYAIAFSANQAARISPSALSPLQLPRLADHELSPLFLAVVEATEEAVLESLFAATTVTGLDGHTSEALPVAAVLEILERRGVVSSIQTPTGSNLATN